MRREFLRNVVGPLIEESLHRLAIIRRWENTRLALPLFFAVFLSSSLLMLSHSLVSFLLLLPFDLQRMPWQLATVIVTIGVMLLRDCNLTYLGLKTPARRFIVALNGAGVGASWAMLLGCSQVAHSTTFKCPWTIDLAGVLAGLLTAMIVTRFTGAIGKVAVARG